MTNGVSYDDSGFIMGSSNFNLNSLESNKTAIILETIINSNFNKNFINIKFFNLNSNFDQATHKEIKKAILCGKFNCNNAKYCGTNMMSQINAPIQGYTNPPFKEK